MKTTIHQKYPKTPHLPMSPGYRPADDIQLSDMLTFANQEVVITEKLDGENTTMYHDFIHARSLDSGNHPTRSWVKALHGRMAHLIPPDLRICGENVFATHSIHYDQLPTYFFVFAIFSQAGECWAWDDVVRLATELGLTTVPVLYRGPFNPDIINSLSAPRQSLFGEQAEGYVIRNANAFPSSQFPHNVAKYVRPHHITTDTHWMHQRYVSNQLKVPEISSLSID